MDQWQPLPSTREAEVSHSQMRQRGNKSGNSKTKKSSKKKKKSAARAQEYRTYRQSNNNNNNKYKNAETIRKNELNTERMRELINDRNNRYQDPTARELDALLEAQQIRSEEQRMVWL
jgi:hypothetical protein